MCFKGTFGYSLLVADYAPWWALSSWGADCYRDATCRPVVVLPSIQTCLAHKMRESGLHAIKLMFPACLDKCTVVALHQLSAAAKHVRRR